MSILQLSPPSASYLHVDLKFFLENEYEHNSYLVFHFCLCIGQGSLWIYEDICFKKVAYLIMEVNKSKIGRVCRQGGWRLKKESMLQFKSKAEFPFTWGRSVCFSI